MFNIFHLSATARIGWTYALDPLDTTKTKLLT